MSEDVDEWDHCHCQSHQYEDQLDESVEDFVELAHRIFYSPISYNNKPSVGRPIQYLLSPNSNQKHLTFLLEIHT